MDMLSRLSVCHGSAAEAFKWPCCEVMPQFKQRDTVRRAEKARALAPYIAAALARKPAVATMCPDDIPTVEAFGRNVPRAPQFSDRGGAIAAPTIDPHAVAGSPARVK